MNWLRALLTPRQKESLRGEIERKSLGVEVTVLPYGYAVAPPPNLDTERQPEMED